MILNTIKRQIILILVGFTGILGYCSEKTDSVLVKVKSLDFKNAYALCNTIQEPNIKDALMHYTQLFELNHFKQKGDDDIPILLKVIAEKDKFFYLIKGYEYLFLKDNRALAFKNFVKGLNEVENEQLELKKALLIGLFKVINSGFTVPNEKFKKYLFDYKNIILDNEDMFWYHYYRIELNDLTTDYVENSHENFDFYKAQLEVLNELSTKFSNKSILALVAIINGNFNVKYDGLEALGFYTKAEELMEAEPFFDPFRFRLKLDISRSIFKMDKIENAILELKKGKNFLLIGNTKTNQLNYNFFLSEFYRKAGKADSSNYYLREVFRLEKEVNYIQSNREISKLEVELETAEKEKQILEEKQKAQITRNWLIAATLALVFGTGIAILVQKNTTKKRKLAEQETLLKQERVDNLLKQQELVSIDAMIEGQEKERQRVANELHDDLGSLMATIKLHFSNVKGKGKDPALKQAQSLLEEAYQKVRGIAHSKNSGVMSSQGLLPAVKKMAYVISETNALEVSVEDFGMGERMENSLELSLFRTIQELVANAIKHAEATKLSIQISQYEDNLNIIIEDNGKGFDRSKIDKSKTGMGLTNIEKRIEHLEGNFTIDSVLGKGTSILIDIPV